MIDPKLNEIFREVFSRPELAVTENTTAADIKEWDSFNHINLVMRVEEEFGISFGTKEIGQLANVGDLQAAIRRKTKAS